MCVGRRFAEIELHTLLAKVGFNHVLHLALPELPPFNLPYLIPGTDLPQIQGLVQFRRVCVPCELHVHSAVASEFQTNAEGRVSCLHQREPEAHHGAQSCSYTRRMCDIYSQSSAAAAAAAAAVAMLHFN